VQREFAERHLPAAIAVLETERRVFRERLASAG
jgi:hypothetical protein